MVMQSLRTGTAGGLLKYILLGLLGMAVGGLVVSDVTGQYQNAGIGSNDVAKIEGNAISIQEFNRALYRNLSRYNISVEQAAQLGLVDEVLRGEIRARVLEHEATTDLKLDLGQKDVAKRVAAFIKPYAQDGEKLQDTLERLLQSQRMTEEQFVSAVEREVLGNILMKSVRTGYTPDTSVIAQELYQFQKQTRDIDVIVFSNNAVELDEPASEEDNIAFYEAIKHADYAIPEYKVAEVALLEIDQLNIEVEVEESELKEMYNSSPDTFMVGEQIVISQAMIQSSEQAQEVYELVQSGVDLKEAVKKIVGNAGSFFPNVSFEVEKMLPAVVNAVSERTLGKTYPPVKTMLGHHVVRLESVIQPAVRPFDEIKSALAKDLTEAKKEEEIFKVVTAFETALDGGESFEDISQEVPLKIVAVSHIDISGNTKDGKNALESFEEAVRPDILSFINDSEEGQIPILQELQDGNFVAVKISAIEPKTFKPYEEVKADVAEKQKSDQQDARNDRAVRKLFEELNAGGTTFELLASAPNAKLEHLKDVQIFGNIPAPLTQESLATVFKTAYNGYAFVPLNNAYGIIKVSGYGLPEANDDEAELSQIREKLTNEAKDEAFLMYLRMLNEKYDTKVNDSLINRVYKKTN